MARGVMVIGLPELLASLTKTAGIAQGDSARRIVGAGAKVIQAMARANVRARLNRNARGRLEADITTEFSSDTEATVGPRTVVYAAIHEFGGVIVPRRARFLAFEVDGQTVFTKRVRIPARPYMRPAYDAGRRPAQQAMATQAGIELRRAAR